MDMILINKALQFVKTVLENDEVLFGGWSSAYHHILVTFQDEAPKATAVKSADKLQTHIDRQSN